MENPVQHLQQPPCWSRFVELGYVFGTQHGPCNARQLVKLEVCGSDIVISPLCSGWHSCSGG
eukprot:1623151-Karenia_brevis.AAC.1